MYHTVDNLHEMQIFKMMDSFVIKVMWLSQGTFVQYLALIYSKARKLFCKICMPTI